MKFARALVLVVAASAAPALAQDAPVGPGGGAVPAPPPPAAPAGPVAPEKAPAGPEKAPEAKKERVVDAKALEACERYRKMLASPSRAGFKEFSCRGEFPIPQLGGEAIGLHPSWSEKKGLDVTYDLPESLTAMIPPEQLEMVKRSLTGQLKPMVQPYLEDPLTEISKYNLAYKESDGKVVVTMTPFDTDTGNERQQVHFSKDGLIVKIVMTPKVDPNDPQAAMMAGTDIDVDVKHEKRGEKFVMTSYAFTLPMGEVQTKVSYYDGPSGTPLPKSIEIAAAMMPEPQVLSFYDWTVDGKAVDGTAKPKAPEKKAEPVAPIAPVPAEPVAPQKIPENGGGAPAPEAPPK